MKKEGDSKVEGIVIDASIAMTWCFPDEHSDFAYRVLDALDHTTAIVPALWAVEIANALVVGERRSCLTASDIARFFGILSGLPVETDTETAARAFAGTLELARTYSLTAYDAAYLELAMREGLTLATLDGPLKKAAGAAGVKVF